MPQLTVNYSGALVDLIQEDHISIAGIEVGPWFSPNEIKSFQQTFPTLPFYFHASSIVSRIKLRKKSTLRQLAKYLESSNSPWLSLHIDLLPWHIFLLSKYLGTHLTPPDTEQAMSQFIETLAEVQKVTNVPIILENLHSLPRAKYNYAASPENITALVKRTACGFLLDIAHARIAAKLQQQDIYAYIEGLPLEKLEQIHVSGIRMKNGQIHDAHESLAEDDYQLLKWVLKISKPRVVTLEYFREKEALRAQILRLQELVAA